jgi:nuclear GTP-binding protein
VFSKYLQHVVDFLTQYAKRTGKLLKGGEPDLNTVSKMILNDWQRGKIPYFTSPPFEDDLPVKEEIKTEIKEVQGKLTH